MMNIRAVCCIAIVMVFLSFRDARGQGDPIFSAAGFQQNHDYFSGLPEEHIDSKSGALILTFTDLVLPGNAGAELRFQRSYNSKTGGWTLGVVGLPTTAIFDARPFGSVPVTDRIIGTSDGAEHYARYPAPGTSCPVAGNCRYYLTKEFWLMDTVDEKVFMPDGTVNSYTIFDAAYRTGHLSDSRDIYGNHLTVSVSNDEWTLRQYFEDKQTYREVKWKLFGTEGIPGYIKYTGPGVSLEWRYEYTGVNLTRVVSPEQTAWSFEYETLFHDLGSSQSLLRQVETPSGGRIHYDYENFDTGNLCDPSGAPDVDTSCHLMTPVVSARQTDGNLPAGEWLYAYPPVTSTAPVSTIANPDGSRVEMTYTSDWSAVGENSNALETQLDTRVLRDANGAVVEREERQYAGRDIGDGGLTDGSAVLASVKITRNGIEYLTSYDYKPSSEHFADYHRPWKITEQASNGFTRTTERTYTYGSFNLSANGQPRILGKLAAETVTVQGAPEPTVTRSWTYDSATGFTTSETAFGRQTTFQQDGYGNVWKVTNGNGHTTTYSYDWGVVNQIDTPEYAVRRVVNPEGTVHSETRAGRTTTFEYDDLFRIRRTEPPAGNDIVTDYASDGTWMKVSRGSSWMQTSLDGLGRAIGTTDATGVRTSTVYDAMGRKAQESTPFFSTPFYTGFAYDALGRIVKRLNPDGTYVEIAYDADTVSIRDENNYWTVQQWKAFGTPDDARLVGVTDASGHTWQYTYNGLGQLARVLAPDNVERTWEHAGDLLTRESQPESGVTLYTDYDGAGNLKRKVDANQTVFTYAYDDNERIKTVAAGDRTTTFTYEPGSDNRQTASVDGVQTTFSYDPAGRMSRRVDFAPGNPVPYIQEFGYDGNDNLELITYASQRKVHYTFDAGNRVTRVTDLERGKDYATDFSYGPSGAFASYRTGNQLVHSFGYDEKRAWPTTIDAGDFMHLRYNVYDGVGNVHNITDDRSGGTVENFDYDTLYRLTRAQGPYGEALYNYDPHGNRISNTAATYSYTGFRLMQQNTETFSYDDNGNVKTATSRGATYDYTPDNQLETSSVDGTVASYQYDADGWRLAKMSGGATSVYLRGPGGQLLSENRKVTTRITSTPAASWSA
jgi:YD repeat-containing protein